MIVLTINEFRKGKKHGKSTDLNRDMNMLFDENYCIGRMAFFGDELRFIDRVVLGNSSHFIILYNILSLIVI